MRTLCLLSGLALLANVAACSSGGSPSQENLGTVSAALSTTGPDGATYSVPTTDFLVVAQGGSVVGCDVIQSTATQTTALPAGTYTFYLSTAAAGCAIPTAGDAGSVSPGTQVPFTLNRQTSAGTNAVTSLLLTPAQTLTVAAGSTNSLSFTFAIEQLGTISTGTGTVTTSINTDGGIVAATPTQGSFSNTITMTYAPGLNPPGSSGTNALFNGSYGAQALAVAMSGIGAFAPTTSDSTCATFTPVVTAPATYPGIAALAQELSGPGAIGTLCFFDQDTLAPNAVTVTVNRVGAPVTSTFKSAFAANADGGAPALAFTLTLNAVANTGPYNGLTLNLAPFAQATQLVIASNEGSATIGYTGGLAGSFNLVADGYAPSLTLAP